MQSQTMRAEFFKALHERPGIFVIPNPWDAGSAKLLASLGFEALATTSAGCAHSLGKPDGACGLEETLANARALIAATDLPVSADLENGFGDAPERCAETITLGAAAGLVGGSIEDSTRGRPEPIYPLAEAVERVRAAVVAARALPFPFMLTARAENFLHGRTDLPDTLRRLEAYAAAGADVLYAPALRKREEVAAAVKAVSPKPLNVLINFGGVTDSVAELESLGVKRVSVGSGLANVAASAFFSAARSLREHGRFEIPAGISGRELNALFAKR